MTIASQSDPWAGWRDAGPQAPSSQSDPWAGWRDAGPGSTAEEEGPTFAERSAGAFDPSYYRPKIAGGLTPMREVPEPDWETQSVPQMMRNVSQRARNTALGTGPGSVAGIPGVTSPLWGIAFAPLATTVARSAAIAAKHLPATALAATGSYVASHFDDQPEWLKEFVHNLLLHVQLSAGGKR